MAKKHSVLVAPDKFRGSLTQKEVANAISKGFDSNFEVREVIVSDGGDGFLESLGVVPNKITKVAGAQGNPIDVPWYYSRGIAIVESSNICGIKTIPGGVGANKILDATTKGVGQLINKAVYVGAHQIIIGVGGTATMDGAIGAINALEPTVFRKQIDVMVACDVRTRFLDAPAKFGPQKNASKAEIELLKRRFEALAESYLARFGIEITTQLRTGAGGGLSGGLFAGLSAELIDGSRYVIEKNNLEDIIADCDIVVTGEGCIDSSSFEGKIVGEIVKLAKNQKKIVIALCGCYEKTDGYEPAIDKIYSLKDMFEGRDLFNQAAYLVTEVVRSKIAKSL